MEGLETLSPQSHPNDSGRRSGGKEGTSGKTGFGFFMTILQRVPPNVSVNFWQKINSSFETSSLLASPFTLRLFSTSQIQICLERNSSLRRKNDEGGGLQPMNFLKNLFEDAFVPCMQSWISVFYS